MGCYINLFFDCFYFFRCFKTKLFDKTKTSFDINLLHSHDAGLDLISGSGHDDEGYIKTQPIKNLIMGGYRKMIKKEKSIIDFEDIENVWGFAFENSENYKSTYFSIIPVDNALYFKGIGYVHVV